MKRQCVLLLSVILFTIPVIGLGKGFFKIGQEAPTFSLMSLKGQSVSIQDLRGKVVVLGLFHICEPCLIQGTNLQKVYEATRGKNVAVVGVNSSGDSAEDIGDFLQHFPVTVTYPYLVDPQQVTDKLYGGGKFIPNIYIIDQQGVIRWQRVGNFFTDGKLAGHEIILEEVNRLLAGSTPSSSAL
ncbi:MAG: TlpA disulfide reductase family protein [Nitrospirae bacterium]|nr:TlpA disulfide reductase family protein [Nitrospirota bacterium]